MARRCSLSILNGKPAVELSGSMVFAGNGYTVVKGNINPYEGLDVKGKIVVIAGLPPEIAAQQGAAGGRGGRGGRGAAGASGAASVLPATDAAAPAARRVDVAALRRCPILLAKIAKLYETGRSRGEEWCSRRSGHPELRAARRHGCTGTRSGRGRRGRTRWAGIYGSANSGAARMPERARHYRRLVAGYGNFPGREARCRQIFYAGGTNAKADSFELNAEKKINMHIGVHREPGHGEDVIGILEGGDPVLKNEYVVMSAHLDHIGLSAPLPDGHNVNNGADDDGSGSSALLAMARAFAEGAAKGMRPKRSSFSCGTPGKRRGFGDRSISTNIRPSISRRSSPI